MAFRVKNSDEIDEIYLGSKAGLVFRQLSVTDPALERLSAGSR